LQSRSLPILLAAVSVAIVVAFVGLASQTTAPTPLTVVSKDGRRPIAIAMVSDQEYVALDDLATVFQLTVRDEALGALTVSYKGKIIVLTPDQALASVAGRLVSLPGPPSRSGRRWLVPVEFINRALALIYDSRLDLRKPSHLLVVGEVRVPHLTVRYDLFGAGGRLTIDATPRAASTVMQDGDRLTIKFDADALDVTSPLLPPQTPQSLAQTVRAIDPTSLVVELGPRFAGFRAAIQPVETTTRLVIDLIATPAPADSQAVPAPAPSSPASPDLPPDLGQPVSAVRTIAIDPGHGGNDDGVTGADGTKEKDVTLTVARRIKTLIEGRLGIRVLLTRDDDRNVPVDDRTAIANNNKADLFISLHANASLQKAATGASIYYAAFDDALMKTAVANRTERLPTFGGGARDIDLVLWDLAQTRHVERSMALAAMLEEQFRDKIPLAARAIERAPLRVLESANMPAVLVEMGFLTNADQAPLLSATEFQTTFAQAVFDAVVKFRDEPPSGDAR
jgi:N-acetylmuramoyl-L-alanine amidase